MITVRGVPLMVEVYTLLEDLRLTLESQGVHLLGRQKKSGASVQFSCPFHGDGQERHASCGVLTKDKHTAKGVVQAGTFNCFACGKNGSIEEFVSLLFGKTDAGVYGYKWLVSHYCSVEVVQRQPLDLDFTTSTVTENVITEEELEKYRFYHQYMWDRSLTKRVVDYFDVGYDFVTDSITFPVKDLLGIPRYIQRRSVKTKFFKFDENANKGNYVYGLYEASLNKHLKVMICESPIDALTAWTRGYAGVATVGAMVTPKQIQILNDFPVREYIIATDADAAGDLAARKLSKMNKILFRMSFDGCKDINAMSDSNWENKGLSLIF